MDAKLKADWISALRSGEYKQCKQALSDGIGGNCCLGVLGRIAGLEITPDGLGFRDEEGYFDYRGSDYPELESFGIGAEIQSECILMNDQEGKTFSEIADHIEENIPTDHSLSEPSS